MIEYDPRSVAKVDAEVPGAVESRDAPSSTPGVDWRLTRLALVPSLLFCGVFIVRSSWTSGGQRRFTLFDDAMISMTYGRTLARGGGFVWFVGAPRVEGISNPLWTLFMAALHAVGLNGSSAALAVMVAGVVLIAATAFGAAILVNRLVPSSRWAPPLAALAVGLTYPLLYWTLRGMEVGLVTLLTVASTALAAGLVNEAATHSPRRVALLAAVLALGVATRLDFAVVAMVIVIWAGIVVPRARRVSVVLTLAGVLGIVIGAMTAAREQYFGKLVPNTYVLKLTGVSIAQRLRRGVVTDLPLAPIAFLGVIALLVLWRGADTAARRRISLVAAVATAPVVYSTYVGGDAWERMPNRYVTTSVVYATIVLIAAGGRLASRGSLPRPQSTSLAVWAVVVFALSGLLVTGHPFSASSIVLSVALGLVGAVGAALQRRPSRVRRGLVVVAAVSALLASSAASGSAWVGDSGRLVKSDAHNTDYGLFLAKVTNPHAVIASVTAGALAYYSDRPAVDILGKSDAHVASSRPRGSFRPGHNKWDYAYSIGRLHPDVVAQLFQPTRGTFALLRTSGYEDICVRVDHSTHAMWVRRVSTRIRWNALHGAQIRCGT